jgi:hypothetical protein
VAAARLDCPSTESTKCVGECFFGTAVPAGKVHGLAAIGLDIERSSKDFPGGGDGV